MEREIQTIYLYLIDEDLFPQFNSLDIKPCFHLLGDGDLPSSDVLTCGECNKKFALQQLVTYIQHKATNCNKQMQQSHTKDEDVQMDLVNEDTSNMVEEVCRKETLRYLEPFYSEASWVTKHHRIWSV